MDSQDNDFRFKIKNGSVFVKYKEGDLQQAYFDDPFVQNLFSRDIDKPISPAEAVRISRHKDFKEVKDFFYGLYEKFTQLDQAVSGYDYKRDFVAEIANFIGAIDALAQGKMQVKLLNDENDIRPYDNNLDVKFKKLHFDMGMDNDYFEGRLSLKRFNKKEFHNFITWQEENHFDETKEAMGKLDKLKNVLGLGNQITR